LMTAVACCLLINNLNDLEVQTWPAEGQPGQAEKQYLVYFYTKNNYSFHFQ